MSDRELFWCAAFFVALMVGVVVFVWQMPMGERPTCDPPRHWVPVSCSKGCLYDCR